MSRSRRQLLWGSALILSGAVMMVITAARPQFIVPHIPVRWLDRADLSNPAFERARELCRDNRPYDAVSVLHTLAEAEPDNARVHFELARIFEQQVGNSRQAVLHYQRYLAMRPHTEKRDLISERIALLSSETPPVQTCRPRPRGRGPALMTAAAPLPRRFQTPTPTELPVRFWTADEDTSLQAIAADNYIDIEAWARLFTANRDTLQSEIVPSGTRILIPLVGHGTGPDLQVDLGRGTRLNLAWIPAMQLWAARDETTNAQVRRFRPEHGSGRHNGMALDRDDQPAVNVSCHDAELFCRWLNGRFRADLPDGFRFRLPSADEWERLAACGGTEHYPWGSAWPPSESAVNLCGEEVPASRWQVEGFRDGHIVAADVTALDTNGWGVAGMSGNVWEWCGSPYGDELETRVIKGGAWNNYSPRVFETAFRAPKHALTRDPVTGFRVVLAEQP